ncbi:MAG: hypothetical protein LBB74_06180 [Chitinispirillales bacterium]|nr:hypothetical protein [Chitinispirillales bacterium]
MRDIVKFRFAGIGIVVAMCAAFGAGVMLLWNALMPQIFELPQVGYLQSVGLLVLARLLFGGIDHRHPAHHMHREMHHGNMLRERWAGMSEAERAAVIGRNDPRFWDFMRDRGQTERVNGQEQK